MCSNISFGSKRLFSALDQSPLIRKIEADTLSPLTKKSFDETMQDFTNDDFFSPENSSPHSKKTLLKYIVIIFV